MKWPLFLALVCSMSGQQPVTKSELLGHFAPESTPGFVRIDRAYTRKPDIYLRSAAYAAFEQMHAAAKAEGIQLEIVSATRNFAYQKGIWERKWKRERYMGWQDLNKVQDIMQYSAMPGTSRHHWGTDIDLNALENDWFERGEGKAVYAWLQAHAATYGFHQTYTAKASGRTGYAEEKWHWSYLPLSGPFLEQYLVEVSYEDLIGFSGAASAHSVRAIEDFVLGIDVP